MHRQKMLESASFDFVCVLSPLVFSYQPKMLRTPSLVTVALDDKLLVLFLEPSLTSYIIVALLKLYSW